MRLVIRMIRAIACLATLASSSFGSQHPAAPDGLRNRVEEAVAQIRAGDLSKNAVLRQMGKEAVPILIEYASDENRYVRWIITMALGESLDERAIPVLLDRLLVDDNSNVWSKAINGLCRFPVETLKKHSPDKMLQVLALHAGRWQGDSDKAALLIGDLGGKSQMDALRKILRQAGTIRGDMDVRTHLVPRMKDACLKALFKLGDKNATERVRASLKRRDIPSIVFAIEAVAYAGKKEYIGDLVAFLDDDRDAVRPSPGWGLYLRVKDIAVNAIVQLSGIRPSFRLRNLTLYTDDEVAEVKKLMAEAKTN